MYSAQDLQRTMLQIARDRCDNPRRWMAELASVLNKTKHSIYKKVQGDIGLSLDEMIKLAEYYELCIDPLLRPDSALSFEFKEAPAPGQGEHYLGLIESQLDKISKLPDVVLWHSGIELPFVHDYNFPRITAFKFYIHQKTLWNNAQSKVETFDLKAYLAKSIFIDPISRILEKYYAIPSIEFWNTMILDITLSQIRYTLESGLFKVQSDAILLCDDLARFLDHMELMATQGSKINCKTGNIGASFDLYYNEIAHSNNLILAASKRTEYIFLSFGNPHYMFTTADRAVHYTRGWFLSLQGQSQRISHSARKVRTAFFNQLRKRVLQARAQIENSISLNAL